MRWATTSPLLCSVGTPSSLRGRPPVTGGPETIYGTGVLADEVLMLGTPGDHEHSDAWLHPREEYRTGCPQPQRGWNCSASRKACPSLDPRTSRVEWAMNRTHTKEINLVLWTVGPCKCHDRQEHRNSRQEGISAVLRTWHWYLSQRTFPCLRLVLPAGTPSASRESWTSLRT